MDRRIYDQYVLQVVAQGSLTKAAAQLGISQPALSSGITALEKELGCKLLDRRSVPVTLTAEGRIYMDYVERMQVLAADMERRMEAHRAAANQRIAVGGPVAYVESLVTDAIIRFTADHPDVTVQARCSPLDELIDMASRGEISCFISTSDDLPANFEKHLLRQERVYLCVPASFPVNSDLTESLDYAHLSGQSFIFLEDHQPLQRKALAFLREHGVEPASAITVNQVSTAVNLSRKGAGVCFATEAALACLADRDSVRIYPLPDDFHRRNIYVAYDRQLFMPAACWEFIRCLMNLSE